MATWQSATSRSASTPGRKLKPKVKARRPKAKARPKPKRPAARPAEQLALDPDQPLTQRQLDEQIAAATSLQYGGVEQALGGQAAVSGQMMRNIPSWFAEYQAALAQATNRTQQAYGAALGVQQNLAQSSTNVDTAQRGQIAQGLQTDAATRGAQVDPALGIQSQQAASARRAMLDQFSGLTAGLGAAETGYRAGRQVVGAGQGVQAMMDEAQRMRSLGGQAQQLQREKGAYAVKAKADILGAEHTRRLENQAFGLDVQQAQTDAAAKAQAAADRAAARRTTNRNADQTRAISAARLAETQRANRARESLAASRARGQGGLTPAERRRRQEKSQKFRSSVDTAAADAATLRRTPVPVTTPDGKVEVGKDGKPTGRTRKLTQSEIRAQLRKKYKDRDIANAAMDVAIKGYVDVVNEKRLRARGIGIPKSWLAKRPKRKKKTGAVAVIQRGGPGLSRKPPVALR